LLKNRIEKIDPLSKSQSSDGFSKPNWDKLKKLKSQELGEIHEDDEEVTSEEISDFDSLEEFDDERKQEILTNFADKHKLSEEDAKIAINAALEIDRQQTIDKLKECY
jgi:hypothetical protein